MFHLPRDPKQKWLLPHEITEFIPEGHPARFMRDLVLEWTLVCTAHNLLNLT